MKISVQYDNHKINVKGINICVIQIIPAWSNIALGIWICMGTLTLLPLFHPLTFMEEFQTHIHPLSVDGSKDLTKAMQKEAF